MSKLHKLTLSSGGTKSFRVGKRRQVVPDGSYAVKVVAIEDDEVMKNRPILKFVFQIVEGPMAGEQLRGFVPIGYECFSEYTKLYQWYRAATGDALEEGEQLDTRRFFDRVLSVKVQTKLSKKTKNPFSNVVDIERVIREI